MKLERQAINLKEMNAALKILSEQRDKEKADIKENLLISLKKLISPYIKKLGLWNKKANFYSYFPILSRPTYLINPH